MKFFKTVLFLLMLCQSFFLQAGTTKPMQHWLINGPHSLVLPLYADQADVEGKPFALFNLFEELQPLTDWAPESGDTLYWNPGQYSLWQSYNGEVNAHLLPQKSGIAHPQTVFLTLYIKVNRFSSVQLTASSFHCFEISVDGKPRLKKKQADTLPDSTVAVPGSVSTELSLKTGLHTVRVKALQDPASGLPWHFEAGIEADSITAQAIQYTCSPFGPLTFEQMMTAPVPERVSLSANSKWMAVQLSQYNPETASTETWYEIRDAKKGALKHSCRGWQKLSSLRWSPADPYLAAIQSGESNKSIIIYDCEKGALTAIPAGINLQSLCWLPDGSGLILSLIDTPKASSSNLLRIRSNKDRQPSQRTVSLLYHLDLKSRRLHRLIHGRRSAGLMDIAPDSRRLLFRESRPDPSARPYTAHTLKQLDRITGRVDTLGTFGWLNAAQYSPDGKQILIIAGASLHTPDSVLVNDYDSQAYLINVEDQEPVCLTSRFSPAIVDAKWIDKAIYFKVREEDRVPVYQYDFKKQTFKKLPIKADYIRSWDISNTGRLVCSAFGVNAYAHVRVLESGKKQDHILFDPGALNYQNTRWGAVKDWDWQSKTGRVQGRYYLPPNFNAKKKYPCIVYYYGGTSPVSRTFAGRYPFELYAAHGYIVIVLNPTGSIGYGQAHAADHVNDWGIRTAGQLIESAGAFINNHTFIDEDRVGCIGASFGGFMTQLLITQTDMFSAAISHAGISNISSYWGEGYWGVGYNAVSAAHSFPWNRKDIYVDQSPLYHADKITTPLLLLHGDEDTNVPVGESTAMYNALQLLNRDVELIFIKGQNHHINQPKKRREWTYAILAWFDWRLKGEAEWWQHLFDSDK